jgi:hypothetical protein
MNRANISALAINKDTHMNRNGQSHGRQRRPHPAPGAVRAALLLIAVVALAACATAPREQDPLVERAQARWDAIIARDYDAAYALYSPGYRSTTSRTDFEIGLRTKRVGWTAAKYREHQCQGEVCTVTFDIEYVAQRPVPGVPKWEAPGKVDDTWILSSGEWWYVPPER